MTDIVTVLDEGLGNSAYVVDIGDRRALVLDPERDPGGYLAAAEQRGLHVAYTVETHLHADFVSGSRELAARGAQVVASAAGGLEFPHRGVGDGDEVDLGGLTLRALATPGHTPEHLAYLLLDGREPLALFSGGSLLVGAVARTDLISPERTEELARSLWRSLHERILGLPDELPVYPTHGAGSFCSAPTGAERTTTIGREKAANPLLAAPDEDAFVTRLLDRLGSYPSYFLRLREVNRRGPTVHGTPPPPLARLTVDRVDRLVAGGAQLVDARPVAAYAAGHVAGALSLALRPAFATWLGWLADPSRPLVFVLDDDQDRADLVRQALNVGYENLAGELAGGMGAWEAAGRPVATIPLVDAAALDPARTIDVRQASEFGAGHVPGARNIELGALADRTPALPSGPLTLACGHGERAMTAASVLAAAGRHDLSVLDGGPDGWARATRSSLER
ncbi:MAG TPA: MBL fold metallo-hydrolase [Acidimicrobiales bacterium]|nr:MBL fold metallo-hydrolase [Acidimicrobiales bacterium]